MSDELRREIVRQEVARAIEGWLSTLDIGILMPIYLAILYEKTFDRGDQDVVTDALGKYHEWLENVGTEI